MARLTITQGKSSKFAPYAQKVGLSHLVQDEDVVSSACLTHKVMNLCSTTSYSIHEVGYWLT